MSPVRHKLSSTRKMDIGECNLILSEFCRYFIVFVCFVLLLYIIK